MLWPIALMRWWSSTMGILMPAFCVLGALAGFAVGAVRFHVYRETFWHIDVVLFTMMGLGFSVPLAMFVPLALAAIWFGWPVVAAGVAFWLWLARKYPQKDPAMLEAEREVERIIGARNGDAP
jgi:hypothetical protein